jgi:hypothetical protein
VIVVFGVILGTDDRPHSLEHWCAIQLRTLAEADELSRNLPRRSLESKDNQRHRSILLGDILN